MAKLVIKGLSEALKSIGKTVNDTRQSQKLLSEIAMFAQDRIKQTSRSGNSLVTGRQFKKLKESTLKSYQSRVRNGDVDTHYINSTKSNVTLTGQMLASVGARIEATKGRAIVFVADSRRTDSDLTNDEIADHVKAGGRPFLGMDKKGVKRMSRFVKDEFRRQKNKS